MQLFAEDVAALLGRTRPNDRWPVGLLADALEKQQTSGDGYSLAQIVAALSEFKIELTGGERTALLGISQHRDAEKLSARLNETIRKEINSVSHN